MEIEVLKSGSFEKVITSHEALTGIGRNMKEIIQVLKAMGSRIGGMTRVFGAIPPRAVGLLMSSVMSPNGMSYALIKHNHFKVGYAVREVIADARKYGINAPQLYAVEILITE